MLFAQTLVILTILGITTAGPLQYRGSRLQLRHDTPSAKSASVVSIVSSKTCTKRLTPTGSAVQSSQPQTSPLIGAGPSESSASLPVIVTSIATAPSESSAPSATTEDQNTDTTVTVSLSASVFSETEGAITFLDDGRPVGTRTATTFEVTSFGAANPAPTGYGQTPNALNAGSPSSNVDSASKLATEPVASPTAINPNLPTSKAAGKQRGSVQAIGNGPGSKEPNFSTVAPTLSTSVSQLLGPSTTGNTILSGTAISEGTGATPTSDFGAASTSSADQYAAVSSADVGVSSSALNVQPLPSPSSSSPDNNPQLSSQPAQASNTFGEASPSSTLSYLISTSGTTNAAFGQSSFPANVPPTSSVLSSATVPVGNPSLQTSAVPSSTLASSPLGSGLATPGITSSFAAASTRGVPPAYTLPDVIITLPGTGPRLQAGDGNVGSSIQAVPTNVPTTIASSSTAIAISPSSQPLPSGSTFVTITTSTARAGTGYGAGPSSPSPPSAPPQLSTNIQPSQSAPATMTTITTPSEQAQNGQQGTTTPGSDGPSITVVPVAPYSPSDGEEKTVTVTTTAIALVTESAR